MSGFAGFGQNNNNQNKPGAFSFGSAGTATPPASGSLFGQAPQSPANPQSTSQPTSLFGNPSSSTPNAAPSSTTGLFGASTATQPAPGGGGLFGGGINNVGANTGGSLFGNTGENNGGATKPAGGYSFGGADTNNNTSTPTTTAALGTTAPAPSGGMFSFGGGNTNSGSNTPAVRSTTPVSKPLFGGLGQSTTPAATPPANSGSSLFGAKPAGTGGGLFGSAPASGTASPSQAPAALAGGSLFGAKPADASATAPTTSLFGAKPSSPAATTTPPTGSLFGGASQQPQQTGGNTPSLASPASGGMFSFGAKPALITDAKSATPSTTPAPDPSKPPATGLTGGFGLFGAKPADKIDPPAIPTAPSPPDAGFSLGGNNASKTATTASTTSEPPKAPSTGFSFGNLGGTSASNDKPATPGISAEAPKAGGFSFGNLGATTDKAKVASTTEPAKPSTGGFSFGGLGGAPGTPSADKVDAPEAPKPPAAGFSFGDKTATSAPAAGGTASNLFGGTKATTGTMAAGIIGTSGAPAAPGTTTTEPAPNLLRGKTLEDIVDGWTRDLDSQVKEFERQAGEVREWDKVLVQNGNQITALHRQVLEAQQTQVGVDKALDYIESQQKQLDGMLTHYEREVNAFASDATKPLAAKLPADRERERSYTLAEDLNKQLDDLSRNLSQMIDEVNKLSSNATPAGQGEGDDPINQLSAILGAHLRALNSIDGNAGRLEDRVVELEAKMGQERGRFGLPRR